MGEREGLSTLSLRERFHYQDGEESEKRWTIDLLGEDDGVRHYTGAMEDIVGEAQAEGAGRALHWKYRMKVKARGSVWTLDCDDWMWKVNESLVMNRITMRKFGFKVAEIIITFQKVDEGAFAEVRPQ